MEIDLDTSRRVFDDVLDGKVTREAADRWACSVIQASETGGLRFTPGSDRERIWRGVMYLNGIDLLDKPDQYLHAMEDIRAARLKL